MLPGLLVFCVSAVGEQIEHISNALSPDHVDLFVDLVGVGFADVESGSAGDSWRYFAVTCVLAAKSRPNAHAAAQSRFAVIHPDPVCVDDTG